MTKSLLRYLRIFGSCCILSSAALAGPIYDITIIPSIGPSYYATASYNAYVVNAEQAIENGWSTNGTPGTPSYYYASSGSLDLSQVIETPTFYSWLGSTALAVGNYANQHGNDLYFGVKITSTSTFSLSDVSFTANLDGFPVNLSFAGLSGFSADTVGIALGSPNTRYDQSNPGTNTTLINDLYSSGASVYFTETVAADLPADVIAIQTAGIVPAVTATYSVSGLGSKEISLDQSVPESSTSLLVVLGCGAIVFGRKFLVRRLG